MIYPVILALGRSPVSHTPGVMVYPVIPALGRWRKEGLTLKARFIYVASLGLAWTTWDPVSKQPKGTYIVRNKLLERNSLNDSVTTRFRIHLRVTFCIIFIFLNNSTHLELLVISCLPLAWCLVPMWLHSHGEGICQVGLPWVILREQRMVWALGWGVVRWWVNQIPISQSPPMLGGVVSTAN